METGVSLESCWPDWQLAGPIDSGGYSSVYKAVHRGDADIQSAIKIIRIPSDPSQTDTLRKEGKTEEQIRWHYRKIAENCCLEIRRMAALKGTSHIVSMEDFAVVPDIHGPGFAVCIRMELLRPLMDYLSDKNLTETEILQIGIDICDALILCHKNGILHLDVKPDNIFVNDRLPTGVLYKLGDFGISEESDSPHADSPRGTPFYSAPEMFGGQKPNARSDLYALGLTLYQLANHGNLPFLSDRPFHQPEEKEIALKTRLSGVPVPAPANASSSFSILLRKACAADPEKRFGSAKEMQLALRDCQRLSKIKRPLRIILFAAAVCLAFMATFFIMGKMPVACRTPEVTGIPLISVSEQSDSAYLRLLDHLVKFRSEITGMELIRKDAATVRIPRNIASFHGHSVFSGVFVPPWSLDASVHPFIISVEDTSNQWNPLLLYENGQLFCCVYIDDDVYQADTSAPEAFPQSIVLTCETAGVSARYIYEAVSRELQECCVDFFLDGTTASVSLDYLNRRQAETWTLQYNPKGLPRVTARYDADGNLLEILRAQEKYNFSSGTPDIEGVEIFP